MNLLIVSFFLFFVALSFWIVDICSQFYYFVVLVDGGLNLRF